MSKGKGYKNKPTQRPAQTPTAPATAPAFVRPPLQTMEQRRAQYALQKIEPLQTHAEKLQKELRSLLHSLPALIHMNGLGQTLAFCCMKDKGENNSAHWSAYSMIGGWLHQQGILGESDALHAIVACDIQHYMAATAETQALLQWLKKFATAYLKGDD